MFLLNDPIYENRCVKELDRRLKDADDDENDDGRDEADIDSDYNEDEEDLSDEGSENDDDEDDDDLEEPSEPSANKKKRASNLRQVRANKKKKFMDKRKKPVKIEYETEANTSKKMALKNNKSKIKNKIDF